MSRGVTRGVTARHSLRGLLRVVWWRTRSLRHGQVLLMASLAVAVAGVACVTTVVDRVEATLARESRALLGGDLVVSANTDLTGAVSDSVTAVLPADARMLHMQRLRTMAVADHADNHGSDGRGGSDERDNRARPVQLESLPAGYPFAGTFLVADAEGAPIADPAEAVAAGRVALVQPDLLPLMDVAVGDTITIGAHDLRIAGTIEDRPGNSTFFALAGPLVLISPESMRTSGLTGEGSRVADRLLVGLSDPAAGEAAARAVRAALGVPEDDLARRFQSPRGTDNGYSVRTAAESSDQLARRLRRLADFLHLTVLVAVLLAGIGAAAVVRGALHQGRDELATLRLTGADPGTTTRILLLQTAGVALAGSILGVVVGAGGAWVLLWVAADLLPVRVDPGLSATAIAWGCGTGLVMAVCAAWGPVRAWARQTPAACLRGEAPRAAWRREVLAGVIAIALLIVFGAWQARSWLLAGSVVGGTVVAGAILLLLASLALRLLARLVPEGGAPGGWRRSLRAAARPGRRGAAVVAACGLAALLLAVVAINERSLQQRLERTGGARPDPGLFVLDIQSDQIAGVRDVVGRSEPPAPPAFHPYLRARLRAVNGSGPEPVADGDREAQRQQWAWYREHNLSYRHELSPDETIISGEWDPDGQPSGWCSLSDGMAEMLGAEVGDRLRFEAQGVPLELTVTSIREIDWSFYPNFFVLVDPEVLADAPMTWIGAIPTHDEEQRIALQLALAQRFPNVSAYDVQAIADTAQDLISRVLAVVRGMGAFTLAAGAVVLLGVAMASMAERQAEAALMRVLGARRRALRRELVREHLVLGSVAGLGGVLLSIIAGYGLLPVVLELRVALPVAELITIAAVVALTVVVVAWFGLRRVYAAPPAEVLRQVVDA